ncbi:MAG: DUF2281 domain-containing protein [Armatimonadota bacterium]
MMVQEKEAIIKEIDELPEDLLQEVLDFVRFLKSQAMKKRLETVILSERVLGRDWLRPEEEEAWRDL